MPDPGPETTETTRRTSPQTVDDLSVGWLQYALSHHAQGAILTGFSPEIIGVGEGFMGQLARVHLTYASSSKGAPKSLIAKFAALKPETREFARDQNAYQREIGFYRDIGHDAGVPVPTCYFSDLEPDSYHFVLLLEDLAPGVASDQVRGTSRQTSLEVIEQFGRLHAKWWNQEDLETLDWAKWMVTETPIEDGAALLAESMRQAERTGRFNAYPEMKRLMPLLPPLFRVEPASPYPFTLTHGDLRSDNIIEPSIGGGRFAIIDWQLAGIGDPIYDIARWIVQSISIEDRRETETALLQRYHAVLLENGVSGYSYKKLISDYKKNIIVVLLMFSITPDAVDQSSDRAKALFHQFYSRLDAALLHWQIEKLLRALPFIYPFIKVGLLMKKLLRRKR